MFTDDPRKLAMINAGLGMMANSTGPNSGNAFGAGLQQGMQSYQNSLAQKKQEEILKQEQDMKRQQFEQQKMLRELQVNDIVRKQEQEKAQRDALTNAFAPKAYMPGKGGQVAQQASAGPQDAASAYKALMSTNIPELVLQGVQGMQTLQPKSPKFGTTPQEINGKMYLVAEDGSMKPVGTAPQKTDYDKLNSERDIRKEWSKYQDAFSGAASNHEKLITALTANNGIGDTAAVFNFMKALDPGSVVRGEEQEMVTGAGGVMDQMNQIMAKYKEGELLPPPVRQKIAQLSQDFMSAAAKSHATARQDYAKIVNDYGLDEARVLRSAMPLDIYNQDFSGMADPTAPPQAEGGEFDGFELVIEEPRTTSYAPNQRRR